MFPLDIKMSFYLAICDDEDRPILRENEGKLHELAAYLLKRETITGEEFMSILNAESAPEALPQAEA